MSAKICPPLASEGAVLKKKPLSSKAVSPGEVAEGEIITTPFGTATLDAIAPVTPEQSAPIIAATPCAITPSAAAVAAAESTQVESALTTEIVSPLKSEPESDASLKASSMQVNYYQALKKSNLDIDKTLFDFGYGKINSFQNDNSLGAVQPLITNYNNRATVWNAGGYLNSFFGFPYTNKKLNNKNRQIDWITGCCIV